MATGKGISLLLVWSLVMGLFGAAFFSCENVSAVAIIQGSTAQYNSIQDAIDASHDGDIINVSAGTYNENLVIDKKINLTGDGSANTFLRGGGTGSVIIITSDWVNISGFNISDSGKYLYDAGITLIGVNNCSIANTTVSGNHFGLFLSASYGNTIHNNNFMNNTRNAFDDGVNTWNLDLPSGGNYWDDQDIVDEDENGVMDNAYAIPGGVNRDLKPWTNQTGWSYYHKAFEVNSFSMMIIGMGVVFAILTILWISTELTGLLFRRFEAGKKSGQSGKGESEAVAAIAAAINSRRE